MYNQDQLQEIIDQLAQAPTVADARSILWQTHQSLFYNTTPDQRAYLVYSANTWGEGGRIAADNLTRLGAEIAHRRCAAQGGDAITATIQRIGGGEVPPLSLQEEIIKEAIFWTRFMVHFDDADFPAWYRDQVAREGGRPEHDEVQAVGWPAYFAQIRQLAEKRVQRLTQFKTPIC